MWDLLSGAYDDNRWRTAVSELRQMQEEFERNGVPPVMTMGLGTVPTPQVAMDPLGGFAQPDAPARASADAPTPEAPEGTPQVAQTPSPEAPAPPPPPPVDGARVDG